MWLRTPRSLSDFVPPGNSGIFSSPRSRTLMANGKSSRNLSNLAHLIYPFHVLVTATIYICLIVYTVAFSGISVIIL